MEQLSCVELPVVEKKTYFCSMKRIILVTGGQRSGKSVYAEQLALQHSDTPLYIATARVWDDEMRHRVRLHQERRGPCWTTIEQDGELGGIDIGGRVALIDCVTHWCTNRYLDMSGPDGALPDSSDVQAALKRDFDRFTSQEGTFIFVTNEIGCGGISDNAMMRQFTDVQGMMNQYIASTADEVVLMVSGIAVKIKEEGENEE